MSERHGPCAHCRGIGRRVVKVETEYIFEGEINPDPRDERRLLQRVEFKGTRVWVDCFVCGATGISGEARQP